MRLLLDTHAFLWWITDDSRLSDCARRSQDPEHFIPEQVAANAFEVLPMHLHHILRIHSLPRLHRDPFDREQMALISGDPQTAQYPVDVVWSR